MSKPDYENFYQKIEQDTDLIEYYRNASFFDKKDLQTINYLSESNN